MSPSVSRPFWKMTGSGNDFVFFDNRGGENEWASSPAEIGALCDRRRGVGADGVVLINASTNHAFGMRYYNRDGSLAEMCGNAALCSATLAVTELGMAKSGERFSFDSSSGVIGARVDELGPRIEMVPVTDVETEFHVTRGESEQAMGFARVGVPHLVVLCDDVAKIDVVQRGRLLRNLPQFRDGANVNFVSQDADGAWRMRTYERGVEDETLACGTGTVATVALLSAWSRAAGETALTTGSGLVVAANVPMAGPPTLRGEGRIVFRGFLPPR